MSKVIIPGRSLFYMDPLDPEKGVVYVLNDGQIGVYFGGDAVQGNVGDFISGANSVDLEYETAAVVEEAPVTEFQSFDDDEDDG